MSHSISKLFRRIAPVAALAALVVSMDGTWATAQPATKPASRAAASPPSPAAPAAPASRTTSAGEPAAERKPGRAGRTEVTGKLNLNTATEEQLVLLPTVGPSKAERIVAWRKKNGGFKRVADLRRVKGFGYKTMKRLEPYLDVTGETTLAPKR
ncbi:MAG TPA: helix-hairpin-helix domain-containing protein [Kofleriaceae bacterium]|nr:helix-hairpin-helix domain-containing protein [Kofleriaceae bacterium]